MVFIINVDKEFSIQVKELHTKINSQIKETHHDML